MNYTDIINNDENNRYSLKFYIEAQIKNLNEMMDNKNYNFISANNNKDLQNEIFGKGMLTALMNIYDYYFDSGVK